MKNTTTQNWKLSRIALALFVPISLALAPSLRAQSGSWTADASGNWTDTTNWSGNITANGTSATANFTNNITAARTVTLNTTQTVGILNIGDTNQSHGFTINASAATPLVMNNGGSIRRIPEHRSGTPAAREGLCEVLSLTPERTSAFPSGQFTLPLNPTLQNCEGASECDPKVFPKT